MESLSPETLERIAQVTELPVEMIDFSEATGLVLEIRTPFNYVQWIGPFDPSTMDICVALATLKAEESAEQAEPNQYFVRPLLPPTAAFVA